MMAAIHTPSASRIRYGEGFTYSPTPLSAGQAAPLKKCSADDHFYKPKPKAPTKEHSYLAFQEHTRLFLFRFLHGAPLNHTLPAQLVLHRGDAYEHIALLLKTRMEAVDDEDKEGVKNIHTDVCECLKFSSHIPQPHRKIFIGAIMRAVASSGTHNLARANVLSELMNNELLIREQNQHPTETSVVLFRAVATQLHTVLKNAKHGPYFQGRLLGRMWAQILPCSDMPLLALYQTSIQSYLNTYKRDREAIADLANFMSVAVDAEKHLREWHTRMTTEALIERVSSEKEALLDAVSHEDTLTPYIHELAESLTTLAQINFSAAFVWLRDVFFHASFHLGPHAYSDFIQALLLPMIDHKAARRVAVDLFHAWDTRMKQEEKDSIENKHKEATNKPERIAELSACIMLLPLLDQGKDKIPFSALGEIRTLRIHMYKHVLESFYSMIATPWSVLRQNGLIHYMATCIVSLKDPELMAAYVSYMEKRNINPKLAQTGYNEALALLQKDLEKSAV
jgi:hypothetical protein